MNKEVKLAILAELKRVTANQKGCELLYQILCDEDHTTTMLTWLSMYAFNDPTFVPNFMHTLDILKNGIPDPSVN